ncbi:MAG: tetratricopeptide repeat protein [Armatimonadota bacterium]
MEAAGRTNLERIREYGQALQRDPDTLAFALLADVFREEGMYREALDVCQRGLERHPDYITAHIIMGQIHEDLQELDQAIEEYQAALRLDPGNLVARRALGRILLAQGELEQARTQLEHVLFANPADDEAGELLAMAEGRRPLPEWAEQAEPQPAPPMEAPPPAEAVPKAASGLEAGINRLAGANGIAGAMVVGEDGLVIASQMGVTNEEEAFGALIAEIHRPMRRYAARMDMGRLRRAVIDGAGGKLILASDGARILAVAASTDAKLGMVNMQIDQAMALMHSP